MMFVSPTARVWLATCAESLGNAASISSRGSQTACEAQITHKYVMVYAKLCAGGVDFNSSLLGE